MSCRWETILHIDVFGMKRIRTLVSTWWLTSVPCVNRKLDEIIASSIFKSAYLAMKIVSFFTRLRCTSRAIYVYVYSHYSYGREIKRLARKFTSRNVGPWNACKATAIIRDMLIPSRRATLCTLFMYQVERQGAKSSVHFRDCTSLPVNRRWNRS